MTISPQNPVCPLADKGFLVTDAQTLPSLINAHPTLLVLLQSDPNKHPEVADSWVIIPEILKQFPATSYTAAFADSEQSELIAREYRILKYPALLFFRQHRFVGSLAGLYSWQVSESFPLRRRIASHSPISNKIRLAGEWEATTFCNAPWSR